MVANPAPIPYLTDPVPAVHLRGAVLLLTGKFNFGFTDDCIKAIEKAGGRFGHQSTSIDYLVVGEYHTSRGKAVPPSNKVKEALELNELYGGRIGIISESTWLAALENPTPFPRLADDDCEKVVWEGGKRIRLRYEMMFEHEGIPEHDVVLYQITVRPDNRAVYLWGRKTDSTNTLFRANRICSDIFDVDSGTASSVNAFLQQLTGHDYKIQPFTGQIGNEFVPLITLEGP